MPKRSSTSEIGSEKLRKRVKMYLDLAAESSGEQDDTEDDQDDTDESFLDDDLALPTPLQDEAAWNIMEEYLTTNMTFPQMEAKLTSHLGVRYIEADWAEARNALFSADEDTASALDNLRAVKTRHMSSLARISGPSSRSQLQPGCAWMDKMDILGEKFAPVYTNEFTRGVLNQFVGGEITSSYAYDRLEVEFSDDPKSYAHWESVLDDITAANSLDEKREIFRKWTSDALFEPTTNPVRLEDSDGGVFNQPALSLQGAGVAPASALPTWLITVPSSKTSYLATYLKAKGFQVFMHSTLPGRRCVKAENTLIIREAWPSSHANCFFDVVFLTTAADQSSSGSDITIPGWYRPTCGRYWSDVGYGHLYDPESDTMTLLVPSRSLHVLKGDIGKDPSIPRLFKPPCGETIYEHGGHTYIHGLLSLKLRRTAVVGITIPTPQDILIHKESGCDPAFVQSTLHAYASQHWMQDDLVQVTAGELRNCLGKIFCVDMTTRSASVYMEESHVEKISSTPLMFPIANLKRKVRVGDNVCVLANSIEALRGKTGIVVEVGIEDYDSVVVYNHTSQSQAKSSNLSPDDALAAHHDTPTKGDYVVVVDGIYHLQFGEITEVDLVTQSLTFLSSDLGKILVPIRETAFNPNPTALRYTKERGYDVVAGDTVRVVRGERLHLSGTVLHVDLDKKMLTFQVTPYTKFTTSITYVARIGGRSDRDPMQSVVGQEVFVIHGPMKSYRGTLHSLSQDTCMVTVIQGSRRVFRREHVVSRTGILLTVSFIQAPHVSPPRTPRHSPPPVVSRPADPVVGSSWDMTADQVLLHLSTEECTATAPQDCWTIDKDDLNEPQSLPTNPGMVPSYFIFFLFSLIAADSLAAILHDPRIVELFFDWHMKFRIVKTHAAVWYSSYLDRLIDTLAPNPFIPPQGPVKEGEIAIRYSSRTSNKGMKVDTIPLEVLVPEPLTGPNKLFTLIQGDHTGTIHTTKSAPKKSTEIITMEGEKFARADACIVIKRDG
ncbi:uncharacterized protein EDB91DRAFT_1084081 [Suillus paluster]|uniref:uncharacterized protein n=1 Tax=Suillus paluster TaxID=48578 RepID=UPI001B8624D2|nr:uncharacterized protein EDB91DRAFT_1084081 [Suillus paluster]KAG1734424.1 hypothetical protein EDB91DRAFT_1084081 [Suillus paluster]